MLQAYESVVCILSTGPFIGTPVVSVMSICIYVAGLIQAGCFLPQGGMSYNVVEYSYIVDYVLGSFILCILCCSQGGPFCSGFSSDCLLERGYSITLVWGMVYRVSRVQVPPFWVALLC